MSAENKAPDIDPLERFYGHQVTRRLSTPEFAPEREVDEFGRSKATAREIQEHLESVIYDADINR